MQTETQIVRPHYAFCLRTSCNASMNFFSVGSLWKCEKKSQDKAHVDKETNLWVLWKKVHFVAVWVTRNISSSRKSKIRDYQHFKIWGHVYLLLSTCGLPSCGLIGDTVLKLHGSSLEKLLTYNSKHVHISNYWIIIFNNVSVNYSFSLGLYMMVQYYKTYVDRLLRTPILI